MMGKKTGQLPTGKTPAAKQAGKKVGHRFQKGNKFGRGNPYMKAEIDLRKVIREELTPKDLHDIVRGLANAAKRGNVNAARELLDRIAGKAPQAVSVGGPGGGPLSVEITEKLAEARAAEAEESEAVAARLAALLGRTGTDKALKAQHDSAKQSGGNGGNGGGNGHK